MKVSVCTRLSSHGLWNHQPESKESVGFESFVGPKSVSASGGAVNAHDGQDESWWHQNIINQVHEVALKNLTECNGDQFGLSEQHDDAIKS